MVMVCKDHMTKGLRLLQVPHVKTLSTTTMKSCSFCEQQAKYKLFLSNSSINFVAVHEKRQKLGI